MIFEKNYDIIQRQTINIYNLFCIVYVKNKEVIFVLYI